MLGGKKLRCLIPQVRPPDSDNYTVGAVRLLYALNQAIDQDPYFRLTRDVAPRLDMFVVLERSSLLVIQVCLGHVGTVKRVLTCP